jgi:hypothetical protein
MSKYSDEQLDCELVYILNQHVGKEKAIKRWDLVARVFSPVPLYLQNDDHPEDREIRYAVSRLRAQGHLICDLGDGKGRYLAANEAEFWELYNYYLKPIQARSNVLRAMKKAAEYRWPNLLQPNLFSLDELESISTGYDSL